MSADERSPAKPPISRTTRDDSLSGTNLERAGDHNQRVTLQAVRAAGGATVTRAEIADLTGLTPPAVANITNRLLKDGLIRKAGRLLGGRGQPATKLVVNPDGAFSIGLNIDRDHITIVALDFLGQVRARVCREIHFAMPDAVVALVHEEIAAIAARRDIDFNRLIGMGIAIPDDLGRVPLANRPDAYRIWSEIDVAGLFADIQSGPVIVENDATAAAIGEMQFGHGLQYRNFLYTLISAGLGGGLVVDGHYVRGADGRSGEIGFLPVAGDDQRRTLEDMVSLYALYEDLRKAGFEVSTPDDLEALPDTGQAQVEAWLDRAAGHLAGPFLVMNCTFNPAAHFIGGRLPARFIESLCTKVNARLQAYSPGIRNIAPVKRAELAVDASARGAGILPFNERFLPIRQALMKTA